MAIVGKKSIKNNSSPLKWVQVAAAVIGAYSASKNRKAAKGRERRARADMEKAREAYMEMEFTNPYEGLENPYLGMENQFTGLENYQAGLTNQYAGLQNQFAGLENQYAGLQDQFAGLGNVYEGMENVFEEGLVDTRAADFAREQRQQQLATTLQGLGGAAGASGAASLAQAIAGAETQAARQSSVDIARQQRESEMMRRGEASRIQQLQRGEQSRLEQMSAGERSRLQQLQAGETARLQQLAAGETARLQGLTAAEQARLQGATAAEQARLAGLVANEEAKLDMLVRGGDFQIDMLDRQGQMYVEQQEQRRIEAMYGLSASGAVAAGQATQMANQQYQNSMGNLLGAVGNLYQSGAFSGGGGGGSVDTSTLTAENAYGPVTNYTIPAENYNHNPVTPPPSSGTEINVGPPSWMQ